jgi:hypothetical protein
MKKLFFASTLLAMAVSPAVSGICARCQQTCNYSIGTTFTKTYPISGNKNQRRVLAVNPHNDCVAALNWWCSSSGSVLCYQYEERNYAGATGTWGTWHGPYSHNTPQC